MGDHPKPIVWIRENECIRCTSHAINRGYPMALRYGKFAAICRLILIKRHGLLPKAIVSRHTCDNRWCINPAHVISGTLAENNRDRSKRGRNCCGEGHPDSKLTETQIREIRSRGKKGSEALARKLGVNYSTIWKIRRGKTWKHVKPMP